MFLILHLMLLLLILRITVSYFLLFGNENIELLIDELMDTKFSALGCNCPYSYEKVRPCSNYDNDCEWCKEDWKAKETERLLVKYIVE